VSLLDETALPRDALPYTDEFQKLKSQYEKKIAPISDADFWAALSSIGKGGGLTPSGKRRKVAPRTPTLTDEEQLEILRLRPDGIGNRDHLPYTAEFDEMHRRFQQLTGKKLTKHEFWRGVSRVAKLSRKPSPLFESAPLGDLSPELVQFLERTNPWWKGQPTKEVKRYKRWAFREAMERLCSDIAPVVVIRGPRRIGKTTIQEQIIEHLLLIEHVAPQRILRVQFDDVPGLGSLANPVEAIVRWFEQNVLKETLNATAKRGEIAFLFFDELQNLAQWSEQLKALVDSTSVRTLVTGSSALRISAGRDNLAGRMSPIELGPLRLSEIAGIRDLRELPSFAPDSGIEEWRKRAFWTALADHGQKHAKLRNQVFALFSLYGAYPLCHATDIKDVNLLRQQLVGEVVTKTIEFDPMRRRSATVDPRFIKETFRLLCRYTGQHVRPQTIATLLSQTLGSGVTQAKVMEATTFLCDSLLFHRIPPLEMLLKKNSGEEKFCVCDHFVRDGFLQETVPLDPAVLESKSQALATEAGHIMESVVGYFLHGVPNLDVAWWPERCNEPEVDFVLSIGTQRLPIEVKYRRGMPSKNCCLGIEAFCGEAHYSAPFGLLLTQDYTGTIGDHTIAMPASTFLLVR